MSDSHTQAYPCGPLCSWSHNQNIATVLIFNAAMFVYMFTFPKSHVVSISHTTNTNNPLVNSSSYCPHVHSSLQREQKNAWK